LEVQVEEQLTVKVHSEEIAGEEGEGEELPSQLRTPI
jgi:hypothetical protein